MRQFERDRERREGDRETGKRQRESAREREGEGIL